MDEKLKQRFVELWKKYFFRAELPIAFYYTDEEKRGELVPPPREHRCVICDLTRVRTGASLCFSVDGIGCPGGRRYLGFEHDLMPNFEYFLSCGIPGELEGERYKKSPELVRELLKHHPRLRAPAEHIIFKRWDNLDSKDEPAVVIFFSPPDVVSGLFTLANFDEADPNGVIAPFCSGCASIVDYPYRERASARPRAVLGMFDVSARPCVPDEVLSFAVPWPKLVRMIDNMPESFLTTGSWDKVRGRIE